MKLRYLLWVIVLLLLVGLAFVPGSTPAWFQFLGWAVALVMANFLFGDFLLGRWLKGQTGRQVTLASFLLDRLAALLFFLGLGLTICGGALILKLGDDGLRGMILLGLCGVGTLGVLGAMLVPILRPPDTEKSKLAQIRAKLPVKSLRDQIKDAWEFQRVCGLRAAGPLAVLWAGALLLLTVLLGFCACLAILSNQWSGDVELSDPDHWPFLLKAAVFLAVLSTSCLMASAKLASFRIVAIMRKQGRFPVGRVWRQVGLSLETVGIFGTFLWGAMMTLAIGALIAGGYLIYVGCRQELALGPELSTGISVLLVIVVAWFGLFVPQMYILPVMAKRDCGWMRAMELSLDLIWLERGAALAKAALATAMALSIVGIPGAIALLVGTLDQQDLFLSAVLGDRTEKEIFEELVQADASRPAALQKHYDNLDKGRYLDALNGFQMYLRANRESTDAWRGQSIAYLHMGNPQARESLEMWERLAEDPTEAEALLKEWREGLWSDNGAKFLEADRRCTQRIGTGVTGFGPLPPGPEAGAS